MIRIKHILLSVIFVLLLFAGCRHEYFLRKPSSFKTADSIDIEHRGDTVFRYPMTHDIKKNRYIRDMRLRTMSVYKLIPTDTTVSTNAFLSQKDFAFFFDRAEIERYYISAGDTTAGYIKALRDPANAGCMGLAERYTDLIRHCRVKVMNTTTEQLSKAVLIEHVSSPYSTLDNFYSLSYRNDTTFLFQAVESRF